MTPINDRIRAIVDEAVHTDISHADVAVLKSLLSGLAEPDVVALLDEFFDIEVIVSGVYDAFTATGRSWNANVRCRLAEALIFCGLDAAADDVLAAAR